MSSLPRFCGFPSAVSPCYRWFLIFWAAGCWGLPSVDFSHTRPSSCSGHLWKKHKNTQRSQQSVQTIITRIKCPHCAEPKTKKIILLLERQMMLCNCVRNRYLWSISFWSSLLSSSILCCSRFLLCSGGKWLKSSRDGAWRGETEVNNISSLDRTKFVSLQTHSGPNQWC